MSQNGRMVGNQGAFSLLQMMEDMNRKLEEQSRQLGEQKKINEGMNTEKIHDRAIELLNLSTQVHLSKKDRQERNARIHGANVKLDLQVVLWLQENDRAKLAAAKEGFEVMYGLTFDEAGTLIPVAPAEIIEFIHKRSDLGLLHYYSSPNTQEISSMEQICTDILDLWRESRRRGTGYPEDEIQAKRSEYERLHSNWEASRKSLENGH